MREFVAIGDVKDGRLAIRQRGKFNDCLRMLPDCTVEIKVRRMFSTRSTKITHENGAITLGQNGYYWSVIVQSVVLGYWDQNRELCDLTRAHDELKANCLFEEIVDPDTGSVRRKVGSTKTLDTMQFEDYLERCRVWVKEWFGIDCPPPNEQAQIVFKQPQIG